MTRINCVPAYCLTTKHLQAEYFELPRILTAVEKLVEKGKSPDDVEIPDKYCLGEGHMKFFYNKLQWIKWRYDDLMEELDYRRVNVDNLKFLQVIERFDSFKHTAWWNNWEPQPEDMYLNMKRIVERYYENND